MADGYGMCCDVCPPPPHPRALVCVLVLNNNQTTVEGRPVWYRLHGHTIYYKATDTEFLCIHFLFTAFAISHPIQAARKFVEVSPELGSKFDRVLAPEDVAVYGGLCALATFNREEMKRKVLENASFKNFLDLVPQARL